MLERLKSLLIIISMYCLSLIAAYNLEIMGLMKLQGNQVISTCELYRQYFQEQLS